MIQIYIKYKDDNFYILDLKESESINLKTTVTDLNDITKIFSPFTQSFKFPATDKNKMLVGFYGNEKLQGNSSRDFDCLIYVGGFIFDSGKLSIEEISNEEYSGTFGSTISGLVDTIGDATIQELFDYNIDIVWDVNTVRNGLQRITNGSNFSWGVPFISNTRTWASTGQVDNISYSQTRNDTIENFIKLSEVRPALTYETIMRQLIYKYNLGVICPLFDTPEFKELFILCNAEKFIATEAKFFRLINYLASINFKTETRNNIISGYRNPRLGEEKWRIVNNQSSGFFTVSRNTNAYVRDSWFEGFDILIQFQNLISLENTTPSVVVNIRDADTNALFASIKVENSNENLVFRFKDVLLNQTGTVRYYIEILPENLVSWSSIILKNKQYFRLERNGPLGIGNFVISSNFTHQTENRTLSTNLGGNKINLITLLPKMKAIDFLRSFFKTFKISIISTGLKDNSMYWLTPNNIKEVNKSYSKRIVTYDNGILTSKKKANNYNQYVFAHKESKYYDAVYGNGTRFGELKYPTIAPAKPTKYEVKTDYSILKQANTFNNGIVRTCLAFEKDSPTVAQNGGLRFKPVYEEFTLVYLQLKSLGTQSVASEANANSNYKIDSLLEANFVNYTNGKSLAFGSEDGITDSLYLNYYDDFIELLLNPNTYKSEFMVNLPANEIFLNLANTNQNESNIPVGFRPQNEIILGEQRYQLVDSTIDLVTGKSKLILLNL